MKYFMHFGSGACARFLMRGEKAARKAEAKSAAYGEILAKSKEKAGDIDTIDALEKVEKDCVKKDSKEKRKALSECGCSKFFVPEKGPWSTEYQNKRAKGAIRTEVKERLADEGKAYREVKSGDTLGAIVLGLNGKVTYGEAVEYRDTSKLPTDCPLPKVLREACYLYPGQYVWIEDGVVIIDSKPPTSTDTTSGSTDTTSGSTDSASDKTKTKPKSTSGAGKGKSKPKGKPDDGGKDKVDDGAKDTTKAEDFEELKDIVADADEAGMTEEERAEHELELRREELPEANPAYAKYMTPEQRQKLFETSQKQLEKDAEAFNDLKRQGKEAKEALKAAREAAENTTGRARDKIEKRIQKELIPITDEYNDRIATQEEIIDATKAINETGFIDVDVENVTLDDAAFITKFEEIRDIVGRVRNRDAGSGTRNWEKVPNRKAFEEAERHVLMLENIKAFQDALDDIENTSEYEELKNAEDLFAKARALGATDEKIGEEYVEKLAQMQKEIGQREVIVEDLAETIDGSEEVDALPEAEDLNLENIGEYREDIQKAANLVGIYNQEGDRAPAEISLTDAQYEKVEALYNKDRELKYIAGFGVKMNDIPNRLKNKIKLRELKKIDRPTFTNYETKVNDAHQQLDYIWKEFYREDDEAVSPDEAMLDLENIPDEIMTAIEDSKLPQAKQLIEDLKQSKLHVDTMRAHLESVEKVERLK